MPAEYYCPWSACCCNAEW